MKNAIATITFILIGLCVSAQDLIIDLAEGNFTYPAEAGKYSKIILKNAFRFRTYSVAVSKKPPVEAPLNIDAIKGGNFSADDPKCEEMMKKFKQVFDYITKPEGDGEKKKSELVLRDTLNGFKKAYAKSSCNEDKINVALKSLEEEIVKTIILEKPITIEPNLTTTITISGGINDVSYEFTGKRPGRWLVNYGFLFSSKRMEPDNYFSNKIGTDSFRITKSTKYSLMDLRFAPTIFFSYYLDRNLDKPFNHSIAAGLGVNSASPIVSLGYNVMWNHNIGASIGVVFYEQQKLLGKYKEGQILKEELTTDQLSEKLFYRPNLYFSINLRLASSPFKKESSDSKKEADKKD